MVDSAAMEHAARTDTASKPPSSRRPSAPLPRHARSVVSNNPLASYNGNTALGRRARDLFRIGAAETGGRLSVRQQMAVMNWVRLQLEFEAGNVLLATEVRHAWRAILAAKRAPRAPKVEEPDDELPALSELMARSKG